MGKPSVAVEPLLRFKRYWDRHCGGAMAFDAQPKGSTTKVLFACTPAGGTVSSLDTVSRKPKGESVGLRVYE